MRVYSLKVAGRKINYLQLCESLPFYDIRILNEMKIHIISDKNDKRLNLSLFEHADIANTMTDNNRGIT